MQPKGLPKQSAEACVEPDKKAPPRARPMRGGTGKSLAVNGATRSYSPTLAHVLQNVLPGSSAVGRPAPPECAYSAERDR